jgi:hypothetical protein
VELTANLPSLTSQVTTIEVVSPRTAPGRTVLIAGGFGAFQLRNPAGRVEEGWQEIIDEPSRAIPNALIQDLHYDQANNVLVAGTLGRGSWTISRFIRGGFDAIAGDPPVSQPGATVSQTAVSQLSGDVNSVPVLGLPAEMRPEPAANLDPP